MNRILFIAIIAVFQSFSMLGQDLKGNWTPNYDELISMYQELAKNNEEINLFEMGQSDFGKPIYLCVINGEKDSLGTFIKAKASTTLLINNAIHPGEPDGVNACLLWIEEWIQKGKKTANLPVIAIIPAYNVGGMHNRSGTSRANQEGPEEYGFRGNAKNLDLNRDCIKMDSKNMQTLASIFNALDPDVFIDNHVSNGADYQHVLSYISPVRNRMGKQLGNLTYESYLPFQKDYCEAAKTNLVPYVDLVAAIPDSGIVAFNDLPRYASGYAALRNSIGITVETHMLKPFPERVLATKLFMEGTIAWMCEKGGELENAKNKDLQNGKNAEFFKYNYKLTDNKESIEFKGFEAEYFKSEVTGLDRLFYNREKPWTKQIDFFNEYQPQDSIKIPSQIYLNSSCSDIVLKLRQNGVVVNEVENIELRNSYSILIEDFKSGSKPYEGHFLHSNVKFKIQPIEARFENGFLINVKENDPKFLMNVLVPKAPDSYFAWNQFDSYIQQKEYFSPYVFEDKATVILNSYPALREAFEKRKNEDEQFRTSQWDQLYFIYKNSEYFEPTFNRLPYYFIY